MNSKYEYCRFVPPPPVRKKYRCRFWMCNDDVPFGIEFEMKHILVFYRFDREFMEINLEKVVARAWRYAAEQMLREDNEGTLRMEFISEVVE